MTWIALAVNTENEMEMAFNAIFTNPRILECYDPKDSYIRAYQIDLSQIIFTDLKHKDL